MLDLLKMKAMCSGICEFISKSYSFSTPVRDSDLCRMIQPLMTAIQYKIGNALDCDTLIQWSGIQVFQFQKGFFASVVRD